MSWTVVPPLAAAALGTAAVAVLFGLHFLRVQATTRRVATVMFWDRAVVAAQARVLRARRFSHPKTFAVLATAVALVAAAVAAGPSGGPGRDGAVDVIVVDAAAATGDVGPGGRPVLADATTLARSDLAVMSGAAELVAAWDVATVVSTGAEPRAVVAARLGDLRPSGGAPASAAALLLAIRVQGSRGGSIYWYTDQAAPPAGLPDEVTARLVVRPVRPPTWAAAIVGATFRPDRNDRRRGRLVVRLAGRSAGPVALTLADPTAAAPVTSPPVALADPGGGTADLTFPDLAADGRTVRLDVVGAAGAADQHGVSVRLPRRTAVRFDCVGPPPAALAAALRAIGTVGVPTDPAASGPATTAGRIAVVADAAGLPAGAVAAIRVVDDAGPGTDAARRSPVRVCDVPLTAGLPFDGAQTPGGGSPLPGEPLLTAGGTAVASLSTGGPVPTLYLSRSLLGPASDVPRRAEFPALLLRAVGVLAGWTDAPPVETAVRAVDDPLWPADGSVAPTVVSPPPTLAAAAMPDTPAPAVVGHGRAPAGVAWAEVSLGLALALLTFEGVALAARKVV